VAGVICQTLDLGLPRALCASLEKVGIKDPSVPQVRHRPLAPPISAPAPRPQPSAVTINAQEAASQEAFDITVLMACT